MYLISSRKYLSMKIQYKIQKYLSIKKYNFFSITFFAINTCTVTKSATYFSCWFNGLRKSLRGYFFKQGCPYAMISPYSISVAHFRITMKVSLFQESRVFGLPEFMLMFQVNSLNSSVSRMIHYPVVILVFIFYKPQLINCR